MKKKIFVSNNLIGTQNTYTVEYKTIIKIPQSLQLRHN